MFVCNFLNVRIWFNVAFLKGIIRRRNVLLSNGKADEKVDTTLAFAVEPVPGGMWLSLA